MRPLCWTIAVAITTCVLNACDGGRVGAELASSREVSVGTVNPVANCDAYEGVALDSLQQYVGAMHEHSSYSDGDIHARPADYFAQIRERGWDYAGSSEHSDTLDAGVFISVGSDCFSTPDGLLTCLTPGGVDYLGKWDATAEQVTAASDESFLAIRGIEWTSDRFGHINVYFSHNFSNAKTDLGYLVTVDAFWDWFTRDPDTPGLLGGSLTSSIPFGGASDGLGHFNHPGDKCLADTDAGCDWNDLALVPEAAERMFGMELFNGAAGDNKYLPRFLHALRQGWWLSPVGSEDEHGDEWGAQGLAKTVTLATELSEASFREAWLARRTYAMRGGFGDLRLEVHAAGHPMGAQLRCDSGSIVPYRATLIPGEQPVSGMQLLDQDGAAVATSAGNDLQVDLPVSTERRWYTLQVLTPDEQGAAYAAPISVSAR